MRIVHVMNWYIPDMGYQENFLPVEQKNLGHDVEIITSDRNPPYVSLKKSYNKNRIMGKGQFIDNGINIHRLTTILEYKKGGLIILKGLFFKLRELKPDIVHAHGEMNPITLQALVYCKIIGYKLYIDNHCHEGNCIINSYLKKIYVKFIKFVYILFGGLVEKWLPVTEAAEKYLVDQYDLKYEELTLLPLGVNTKIFYKNKKLKKEGRMQLGYSESDLIIISSGKFTPSKKIHTLISAFSIVEKQRSGLLLLLVGNASTEYMNHLESLIENYGLTNKVRMIDFVKNEDLPMYFNIADVGVWPGVHTISVIEALGTELPIIIPEKDLAYKMFLDANAAVGFNHKNSSSLAEALNILINSPDIRSILSNNARKIVDESLSWEKVAEKSIHIYLN